MQNDNTKSKVEYNKKVTKLRKMKEREAKDKGHEIPLNVDYKRYKDYWND